MHGHPLAEPHNLGGGWVGFDFQQSIRATGEGRERCCDASIGYLSTVGECSFSGLGTGLGSAMIVDGILEPTRKLPIFLTKKAARTKTIWEFED